MRASNFELDKIIVGSKDNDRLSQRQLYELYAPEMFVVCQRYARNHQDAEDMLMEGFLQVFKSLESFRSESSFDAWIRSVMVKTAISHYRSEKRMLKELHWENVDEMDIEDEQELTLSSLEAKQIVALLELMPDSLRTVFNMKAIDDFSFKEIAEMLDKKENAVRISYMRARRWLMKELEKY